MYVMHCSARGMLSADLYVCTAIYGLVSVYACNALVCFGVLLPVGLYVEMFHVAHASADACGGLGHGAGVAPSPVLQRLRGGFCRHRPPRSL